MLHGELRLQALASTEDGRERQRAAPPAEPKRHVAGAWISLLLDVVPARRVADIVYRDVILLRPEEWHRGEALAPPEHVARRGLTLTLRNDPVLDAQPLAAARVRPA